MCAKIENNVLLTRGRTNVPASASPLSITGKRTQTLSFGSSKTEISKHGWYWLKRLSAGMKDASEITNALIAAIGTGIIAPLIILVSPGKGDKEDKDKKFFQAIRQPLSAGLALAFQVPMTIFINKTINNLAYKKGWFKDEKIGTLIPDKKYLQRNITKSDYDAIEKEFAQKSSQLRSELEELIRAEYTEVGIVPNEEKIAKQIEKRKKKFLREKWAERKRKQLISEKATKLENSAIKIEDLDLVTEDCKKLAIHTNDQAYK